MSKGAYIKVGGQLRKVKNIWLKQGGVLRDKVVPKGKVGGVLRTFMEYIKDPGYVYSLAFIDNKLAIEKISPDLELVKTISTDASSVVFSASHNDMTIAPNGDFCISSGHLPLVWKFSHDGDLIWGNLLSDTEVYYGESIRASEHIETMVDGNIFVASQRKVHMLSGDSGEVIWEKSLNAYVMSVRTDKEGNLYVALGGSGNVLRKYTPNGDLVWSRERVAAEIRTMDIDTEGNIYTAEGYGATKGRIVKVEPISGKTLVSSGRYSGNLRPTGIAVRDPDVIFIDRDDTALSSHLLERYDIVDGDLELIWSRTPRKDNINYLFADVNKKGVFRSRKNNNRLEIWDWNTGDLATSMSTSYSRAGTMLRYPHI